MEGESQSAVREQLQAKLHQTLEPGEEILWTGFPRPVRYAADCTSIYGIAAVFILIAAGMTIGGLFAGGLLAVPILLFTVPFGGFFIWLARFPAKSRAIARRTLYAVTSRRALIIMLDVETESFPLDQLDSLAYVEKRDRSGDLILRHDFVAAKSRRPEQLHGFVAVHKVREADAAIRRVIGVGAGAARVDPTPGPSAVTEASALSGAIKAKLARHLDAGEPILWANHPNPLRHRKEKLQGYLFAAIWFGVLLSIGTFVYFETGWKALQWFLLVLVAGGIHILWRAAHLGDGDLSIVYAVTNQRALVAEFGDKVSVRSFVVDRLDGPAYDSLPNGLEDLIFCEDDGEGADDNIVPSPVGFLGTTGIDDAMHALARVPGIPSVKPL